MAGRGTLEDRMLALQQQATERRLGRPMRESEVLKMKAEAKASVMASASVLVGGYGLGGCEEGVAV